MESQSVAKVEIVKGFNRLLSITDAVDPVYLDRINEINWWQHRSYVTDYHCGLRRRSLTSPNELMTAIDREIAKLIPVVNQLSGQQYVRIGDGLWQICEPGYTCGMHTDGTKPNVMIVYWQIPGIHYGTTFYNSQDTDDVFHEFLSVLNTGFFANYQDGPPMWHASLTEVPARQHRLITQYEFFYR